MRIATKQKSLFVIGELLRGNVEAHGLYSLGESAIALRRFDLAANAGATLSQLPACGAYEVGRLLVVLALNRAPDHRAQAVMELREMSECQALRARALLALGTNELCKENPDGALRLYQEAQRCTSGNSLSGFISSVMIAAALDKAGETSKALQLLESIEKVALFIRPYFPSYYLSYLNSRAVILLGMGKSSSALTLSTIVYGSSMRSAYPEWKETHEQAVDRQPRRLVTVPDLIRKPSNVLQITTAFNDEARCEDARYRIGCALAGEHRPAVLEGCAVAIESLAAL
jgi:tetratricopeptide (TPR) repeat protein